MIPKATPERLHPTLCQRSLTNLRRGGAAARDPCNRTDPSATNWRFVDIYQQPGLVVSPGVVASPTLIKDSSHPVRLLVGDFSDEARVLATPGLPARESTQP